VVRHRQTLTDSGEFDEKRDRQLTDWMWSLVENCLLGRVRPTRACTSWPWWSSAGSARA
jgi:putative protein kinase ArgK-like GTPase of G3E family